MNNSIINKYRMTTGKLLFELEFFVKSEACALITQENWQPYRPLEDTVRRYICLAVAKSEVNPVQYNSNIFIV